MHSARLLPPRKALVCLLISILAIPLSGCGAAAGMGYFLGIGRGRKIEPLFEIPEGKLLILVDDVDNRVTWARTRQVLARFVGEELLAHEAVDAVISNESVGKLRQIDLQFSNYSAAEIGRKLGADTVLWIEVKDFFAPGEVQDTSGAAKMAVSVKLLSCGESDPDKPRSARLWPTDGGGLPDKNRVKRPAGSQPENGKCPGHQTSPENSGPSRPAVLPAHSRRPR